MVSVIASLIDFDRFLGAATTANQFILRYFDWLFSYASFAAVILIAVIGFSPLGAKRIGGPDAKPVLARWNWFAITLCTTIAVGILFWGTAEPMFHVSAPPAFLGDDLTPAQAERFALASVFLHWTITPYALYAVPTLAFAISYHTFGQRYSLAAPVTMLFGRNHINGAGTVLDALALFALVAGVAAALGAGVMTVSGGIAILTGLDTGTPTAFLVTAAIVSVFIISSLSGLQRGIRILSDLNLRLFIAMAIFILIAGPTLAIFQLGAESLVEYGRTFISASLTLGERNSDPWTRDWTVFFFANWLAWAPITAMFLGRIAVGYTVREFILFNLILPSMFSIFWMSIFGGAAMHLDRETGGMLVAALNKDGPEAVVYSLFAALPFTFIVSLIFLITVFISFVTAMDSNTLSISSLCLKDNPSNDSNHYDQQVKIFWGLLIGSLSFVMTATTGIDGVRMLSNLGGAPGLIILILCGALLVKLLIRYPAEPVPSSKHLID